MFASVNFLEHCKGKWNTLVSIFMHAHTHIHFYILDYSVKTDSKEQNHWTRTGFLNLGSADILDPIPLCYGGGGGGGGKTGETIPPAGCLAASPKMPLATPTPPV